MSAVQITNAAPAIYQLGIKDSSAAALVPSPDALPSHLPLFYTFAAEGPLTKQLVSGDSMVQMYNMQSFDVLGAYATHATPYINKANANGNAVVIQRLKPLDAGPNANILISLDVLPTQVPVYTRAADGTLIVDAIGNPVQATNPVTSQPQTVAGYKVKFVTSSYNTVAAEATFGLAPVINGNQVDTVTGTQSRRYPVMQVKASSFGVIGKNTGFQIYAPTSNNGGVNSTTLQGTTAYPFAMAVVKRLTATSTANNYANQTGSPITTMSLKPGAVDPVTTAVYYAGNGNLVANYRNMSAAPQDFGPFDDIFFYDANIATLIQQFYDAEIGYENLVGGTASIGSDFTGVAGEKYLFNLFGGQSSAGVPYSTYQFVNATDSVRPSRYTTFYLDGGSDGTMNDAVFASLVSSEIVKYGDKNSMLMNTAVNVESIFYDSGFPITTKYDLTNFISVRKDTALVLSAFVHGQPVFNESQENSMAVALMARVQLFPESAYFGTSTCRALIMGRSGKLISSQYRDYVSCSYELLDKTSKYMGSSDGQWKSSFRYDNAESGNNILSNLNQINIPFAPANAKTLDWTTGLNWVDAYDTRRFFFPALKSVYPIDSSVLTGWDTILLCCEVSKVCDRAWRQYSGTSSLSKAQLAERVDTFITNSVFGRFDNRAIIVPTTYYTKDDTALGYSWTTKVAVYAPNMETVMTSFIQAYRLEDYAPVAA